MLGGERTAMAVAMLCLGGNFPRELNSRSGDCIISLRQGQVVRGEASLLSMFDHDATACLWAPWQLLAGLGWLLQQPSPQGVCVACVLVCVVCMVENTTTAPATLEIAVVCCFCAWHVLAC